MTGVQTCALPIWSESPHRRSGMAAERNNVYKERRDLVVNGLRSAGFTLENPKAAIYVWARLPEGETNSIEFCARLLEETGVSTTPGIVYGQHGEGYLRVSLGTATHRIREAMDRLANWKR